MGGPTEPEVTAVVSPVPAPGSRRTVEWVAPGTVAADGLAETWDRGVPALRTHRGPLGAALRDTDGSLVLATDALGTLPLYWARDTSGRIVVDTVLSRIVDRPDVDDRLDLEGVVLTSAGVGPGQLGADRTAFRAVRVVPAGSAVRFRADGTASIQRHWSADDVGDPDERLGFRECVELLRDAVDAAVRRAVVTDAPIGAHVSGGLDCTSVACRAQSVLGEQGRSLVAGYSWAPTEDEVPRFDGDERDLLDAVEHLLDVRVRRCDRLDTDWWHRRDPNRYPAATHVSERHILPRAQEDGVGVMLSGWGGDELASFNGRGVWTQLIRRGDWSQVLTEQRQHRTLHGLRSTPLVAARSLIGTAVRALPHPLDEARHARAAWRQHRADLEWEAELRAFSPLVADAVVDRRRRFAQVGDPRSYQTALLENGHLQHRIQGWHQVGSLFDISYRYPLLDVEVVEVALSLPWWAWRHDGWSRAAYRSAVAPWVPQSVAWNLRKVEPAYFTRPGAAPRAPEEPPADAWQSDDPGYEAAMTLARSRRRVDLAPAWSPDVRVRSRADRAL